MKRGSMFLLELLAMILVFSLCATVCMRMIGTSWSISRESQHLSEAVYLAEAAAAQLQSGYRPAATVFKEGNNLQQQGFSLQVEEISRSGALVVQRVTVAVDGEVIYELDVTCEEVPQ